MAIRMKGGTGAIPSTRASMALASVPSCCGRGSRSRSMARCCGEVVARTLVAINHQHFFCLRLDLDIDGSRNSVQEMNVVPAPPGKDNPTGNAFLVERRLLRTEREAGRDLNFASHRTWKVFNPNRKTSLGHFPGYPLQPGASAGSYAAPSSSLRQRAGFLDHALWVTRSHADERYPA